MKKYIILPILSFLVLSIPAGSYAQSLPTYSGGAVVISNGGSFDGTYAFSAQYYPVPGEITFPMAGTYVNFTTPVGSYPLCIIKFFVPSDGGYPYLHSVYKENSGITIMDHNRDFVEVASFVPGVESPLGGNGSWSITFPGGGFGWGYDWDFTDYGTDDQEIDPNFVPYRVRLQKIKDFAQSLGVGLNFVNGKWTAQNL